MNEISADELYEGLLAYGLFSEKLPPIFTSKPFFDFVQNEKPSFQNDSHKYVYYENIRNINVPRPLGVPHPIAYEQLCSYIKEIWPQLQEHFKEKTKSDTYRKSRIHLRKMKNNNALFEMNYKNWRVDGSPEIDIQVKGKKYMVCADISSCFPSIYTHALSWALVSKGVAKQTRRANTWYNKLDSFIRKIKHDETHGLLIGPHASNLLSEIILTAVDNRLCEWDFVRAIDDYTCYVDTYENGQRFLVELGAALREYDLSLNHKKTEIVELPVATTKLWKRKLNSLPLVASFGMTHFKLARAYLDYAIELTEENGPNASPLKYAIKTLSGEKLTMNAREYIAKTTMSLSLNYPYLISLIDEYVFSRYCSNCDDHLCIKTYSEQALSKGIANHNYEQASYALYFAIKYGIQLDGFSVDQAIGSGDCIFMLIAYLYAKRNQMREDIRKIKAKARELAKSSFDEFWILVYEVLPLSDQKSDMKILKKAGVSFVIPREEW